MRGTGERQMLNEFTQKFEKRIQYIQTCTKALHKMHFSLWLSTDLKSLGLMTVLLQLN
jgi:hypothetical protein